MDEVLEVVELAADLGLEDAFAWLLRLLGLVAVLAGLGLWLLAGWDLLVVPAALVIVGVVLLVAPSVLLFAVELLG